ncbi:B-cell receptor CD22-like isoform X2 [Danio rerio]|uniref:B-cell receptor CD22-like isoform X2 n=2 Tax=Danio rerio TaxID=7955 RepID=A0AC58G0E4_DANRE
MSGDSVTLSCSSDSNPPAEINWYKGETSVGSGRIFSISKISSDDSGEYKCRATNENGVKYSDPVTLDVQYPPRSVSASISGSAKIISGDSVTLNCSSDSNPPALNFSWFKGETFIGSGRIFNISKISFNDSGEYKCRARNDHGEKYSDPVNVQFQGAGGNIIIIAATSGGLFIIILIIMILCVIKKQRSVKSEGLTMTQNDLHSAPGSAGDALYASVNPKKGRAAECRDAEEIQYATVQFHRDTQMKKEEEEEQRQCDNTPVQQPDQDHSRSKAEKMEDSVIYSSVR